jgi:AraC-like DNA-binding protein
MKKIKIIKYKLQITMSKITNPIASGQPCIHASMHPCTHAACKIIPAHLFPIFLSSQLPIFPLYRRHKMDNNVYNRVLEHVMSVTDEQFANLSVAGLACSLQIDRFKLSRQFKSQSAMTLEEFLFKEKMARAAFLLKTFEDITVKEVSRRIGFCTCDYFIRKFKQYYGVAPGMFKKFKAMFPGIREQGRMSKEIKKENSCAHCGYKSFALNNGNGNWK